MPTAYLASSPSTTNAPTGEHPGQPTRPERLALAEILDLQEVEVPGTAHALRHFFPEA
ncbi:MULTISPECIES: hypothetical protein [unclassified Streptomyces]|uniref:hypothetical protein n=1 Tax=unclassified Streptomyces TaxID=2593676 RepID=UPI0033E75D10